MRSIKTHGISIFVIASLWLVVFIACQPATNTNNSNANLNANTVPANSNANVSSGLNDSGTSFNASEPDKYTATLVFTIQTSGGDKAMGIPPLSVQVGRNGPDRRVEFKLPDGTPLVYLDHDNHHYVLVPTKKQYAELNQESTGAQFQKLMTPAQIVDSLKNKNGVEKVGEEQIDGRTAEKYRYATAKNTNTKAGEVKAEAFFYIDKDTRLPLRTEIDAESSGDVKGVNAARIVAEMRDINTNPDASGFELPTGYSQVAPEKIRQQIDALTSAVAQIVRAMMANMRPEGTASPSPAATTSPQ
jgi:hypothetical protein